MAALTIVAGLITSILLACLYAVAGGMEDWCEGRLEEGTLYDRIHDQEACNWTRDMKTFSLTFGPILLGGSVLFGVALGIVLFLGSTIVNAFKKKTEGEFNWSGARCAACDMECVTPKDYREHVRACALLSKVAQDVKWQEVPPRGR